MSRPLTIALLILAALLLMRAMRQGDLAVATKKEARADSLFTRMLENEHVLIGAVHALDAEYLLYMEERDSLRHLADKAAARAPAIVTRIERVAGDSAAVVEAVHELEAVHLSETTALRSALMQADAMLLNRDSVITLKDGLNADLRLALYASRSEAREWERAAKPELLGIRLTPARGFAAGVLFSLLTVVVLR